MRLEELMMFLALIQTDKYFKIKRSIAPQLPNAEPRLSKYTLFLFGQVTL